METAKEAIVAATPKTCFRLHSERGVTHLHNETNLKPKVIGDIFLILFGAVASEKNSNWNNEQPSDSLRIESFIT